MALAWATLLSKFKTFDGYYIDFRSSILGLYLNFDIAPLKEFISEKSFNRIL